MKSSIQAAKTQLPQLVKAAAEGEEVVLTKNGTPVVKLVPVDKLSFDRHGGPAPDLFKPLSRDELARWEES